MKRKGLGRDGGAAEQKVISVYSDLSAWGQPMRCFRELLSIAPSEIRQLSKRFKKSSVASRQFSKWVKAANIIFLQTTFTSRILLILVIFTIMHVYAGW